MLPKPALALWCEQQIRNGRITVYGIRSPIDLLSDLYQPLLSEEWAGLVIDWWNGCAYPAEHHGPTARTASTWLHLHIDRCDVPEPESLDSHAGDDLLLMFGTASVFTILQRWREVVPIDWLWQLVEYPSLPDPSEIVAALRGAIRDGQLQTWTHEDEPLPKSAWLGGPGRADLAAGWVNLGALPGIPPSPRSPTQGPRWTAALVRLGDLHGWLSIEREGSVEQEPAEAPPSIRPEMKKAKSGIPVDDLKTEMQRRKAAGTIKRKRCAEANALSKLYDDTHPDEPHSPRAIYGHRELKTEYEKLMGQK
jgi:hypothetical protein